MLLVIEHDNKKRGQCGYSEEEINSKDEIADIVKKYEDSDIIVYSVHIDEH